MPEWCKHPDRLELLAKHLETVKPHAFDMGYWKIDRLGKCGTQACAMGHACDIPAFMAMGLQVCKAGKRMNGETIYQVWLGQPDSGSPEGFGAAQKLFGIDADDADALFGDCNDDKTPTRMAERIRVYIDGGFVALAERDADYQMARSRD